MLESLPASTVFEARERNRRATAFLLASLVLLYALFLNLMVLAVCFWACRSGVPRPVPWVPAVAGATAAAVFLAWAHFLIARHRSLDSLLAQIGARDADPEDKVHAPFRNVVGEAAAAIGAPSIRAVVLSTPGLNAFSMADGRGRMAIGITEGLLAQLTRPELSAVVAHEAAHLAHEDSRLVTTACFLFSVFAAIQSVLGRVLSAGWGGSGRRRGSGGGALLVVVLWTLSALAYLVTRLLSMAVSREREYLADADGARMCKDPLSLAESLYKISHRHRGDLASTFSALFIVNPQASDLDEGDGWFADLFSTHPPVARRLDKLLAWAKSDLASLQARDAQEEEPQPAAAAAPAPPAFLAYREGKWEGPYPPDELKAKGLLAPDTWVCPAGTQQVGQVSQNALLLPLLQALAASPGARDHCPRCRVSLTRADYEGAEIDRCPFCRGTLLRAGVLERLISRDSAAFSPDQIQQARVWRRTQKGAIAERDHFPAILCPLCATHMGKYVHSYLTQVIIDRCLNESCGAVWCDGGELETIQMLVQDAKAGRDSEGP